MPPRHLSRITWRQRLQTVHFLQKTWACMLSGPTSDVAWSSRYGTTDSWSKQLRGHLGDASRSPSGTPSAFRRNWNAHRWVTSHIHSWTLHCCCYFCWNCSSSRTWRFTSTSISIYAMLYEDTKIHVQFFCYVVCEINRCSVVHLKTCSHCCQGKSLQVSVIDIGVAIFFS